MKCAICKHPTTPKRHSKTKHLFHFCLNCEFIQKDGSHYLSEKEEFTQYEFHENSIDDPKYVAFFEKFLKEAVFPYAPEGKHALDFGSGPSPVLSQLMERDYGYTFTIYDKFYAPDKSYSLKTYDLITSTEVIEHIEKPLPVFKEWKRLMKDDAILSVMTLLHPQKEEDFWNWFYIRDLTHISFFSVKTMKVVAELVGLDIIYCDNNRYTTFRKSQTK